MTTEDTVKEIKKALRSAMNGVLSAQMRQAGMPYRLVFGVELPRLEIMRHSCWKGNSTLVYNR